MTNDGRQRRRTARSRLLAIGTITLVLAALGPFAIAESPDGGTNRLVSHVVPRAVVNLTTLAMDASTPAGNVGHLVITAAHTAQVPDAGSAVPEASLTRKPSGSKARRRRALILGSSSTTTIWADGAFIIRIPDST